MSEELAFPSLEEMCLNAGLYQAVEIHEERIEDFRKNIIRKGELDTYCVECGKDSHFKGDFKDLCQSLARGTSGGDPLFSFIRDGYLHCEFTCARNRMHKMFFYFRLKDKLLLKIGQYPSVADLQLPGIKKYRNLLPKDDYLELAKAVGLNAHGVGIGSFVYLRRIFERLIEDAHAQAKQVSGWDEEAYLKSRIGEKIQLLMGYLPEFLVENKSIYGILSKGIHELGEDECKQVFPVVRTGIELILDEKIAQAEKEKKLKAASKQIASLKQRYS
uniref:Uncharacterized protein n=1 Tax=Cyanothece sp. (strain PCC 7425 / ATCC 29141) TaxID=395961 RepID=B8HLQ5_CYAP4